MAVAAVSRRIDTVEEIHAPVHRLQDIGRCSDAHQIGRLILRKIRHRLIQNPVHLLVALAHGQASQRISVEIHGGDGLRMSDTDIFIRTALVDSE